MLTLGVALRRSCFRFKRLSSLAAALACGLGFALGAQTTARAQGSPPFITDDPGTPGNRHWEINLGVTTERRPGETVSELPLIDVNYGLGERFQLKWEAPIVQLRESGEPSKAGLGNSLVGLKWRFYDEGEHGLAAAVYPQIEFNNPGHSDERGLVESGSAFLLPFLFEKEFGPVNLTGEIAREFRDDGDTWHYGIIVSHEFAPRFSAGFEFNGSADERFHASVLVFNLGAAYEVNEHFSVLLSVGRELHNGDEPRATLVGYAGMQLRF